MTALHSHAEHLPPPAIDSLRTVSVKANGRVYLSHDLALHLNLKPDQPIDLYPPRPGSKYWYLDLRPKARRRVNWYLHTRPRIPYIPKALLKGLVPATKCLVLQLLPGEPEFPNYYPLQPDAIAA